MLTIEKSLAIHTNIETSLERRIEKTIAMPVYKPPITVTDLSQSGTHAKADTVILVFYAKRVELPCLEGEIIILGRSHTANRIPPTIDLSKFGGTGSGTSRMHAAIHRKNDAWFIQDLASSNGTWVNGVRLTPFVEHQLQSTSQLMLANLEIGLVLPDKASQKLVF